MVTILEPREVISAEPAPAQDQTLPRAARRYQWGYSVPCAGVKCFAFRAEPGTAQGPQFLAAELINERVILL